MNGKGINIYNRKDRQLQLEDDEISIYEEAFMEGYEGQ